jgi:hypothetical protein
MQKKLPSTAFKPGHAKVGGRTKGTANLKTVAFQKTLEARGFNIADALLDCYNEARKLCEQCQRRGPSYLPEAVSAINIASTTADRMARYVYPQKKSIEHSGEVNVKTFLDFQTAALGASQVKDVNEPPSDE